MSSRKWCSIIIPVYNISEYIKQCVSSIVKQKQNDIEIILVDDGSTDDSGSICDNIALQQKNIRVIHKINGGLSDARNAGVKIAVGKYLLFIDGDDYIADNSLSQIHSVIDSNENPDIVCLECVKFYSNSKEKIPMKDGIDERINQLNGNELYEYFSTLPKFPASACTKAVNRDFFIKNSLYFKKGLLSEDLEWAMRLFSVVKKAAYCSADYYMYRQTRVGSITNTVSEKNVLDLLSIFIKGADIAKELPQNKKKKMICSFTEYVFRLIVLHFSAVTKKNRKKVAVELQKRRWVLGTRNDIVSRMILLSYNLLGIRITSVALRNYLKLRNN